MNSALGWPDDRKRQKEKESEREGPVKACERDSKETNTNETQRQ